MRREGCPVDVLGALLEKVSQGMATKPTRAARTQIQLSPCAVSAMQVLLPDGDQIRRLRLTPASGQTLWSGLVDSSGNMWSLATTNSQALSTWLSSKSERWVPCSLYFRATKKQII